MELWTPPARPTQPQPLESNRNCKTRSRPAFFPAKYPLLASSLKPTTHKPHIFLRGANALFEGSATPPFSRIHPPPIPTTTTSISSETNLQRTKSTSESILGASCSCLRLSNQPANQSAGPNSHKERSKFAGDPLAGIHKVLLTKDFHTDSTTHTLASIGGSSIKRECSEIIGDGLLFSTQPANPHTSSHCPKHQDSKGSSPLSFHQISRVNKNYPHNPASSSRFGWRAGSKSTLALNIQQIRTIST